MTKEQEILDEFGKLVIKKVFDKQYKFVKHDVKDLAKTEGYKSLFKGMSDIQKKEIEYFTRETLKGVLFDFLKIFEEHPQFKLYFENEDQKVNLVEISEMLKAEPIIENGWIARFSKEVDKDEII